MKKEKDKKIVQEANSSCGCGENCTCGDNCNCTEEDKCNPDCKCSEQGDHKCDCGCEEDDCHCGDDCQCGDDCDCGCHEHQFTDRAEEFKAYQKAFDQFEAALEKVDRELTLEKARADKNEHLADSYKKDLDRYKAFPAFLKEYLSKVHIGIEHIVTDERLNG